MTHCQAPVDCRPPVTPTILALINLITALRGAQDFLA